MTDDDADDRQLFTEALAEVDGSVECLTVGSVKESLALLDQGYRPDLFFVDINLPEMNGWECLRMMKKKGLLEDVPVVMYSTSSHQKDVETCRELGALGLITKPSDYEKLKEMLTRVTGAVKNSLAGGHRVSRGSLPIETINRAG